MLLSFLSPLAALEIVITSGVSDSETYQTLTLEESEPFECRLSVAQDERDFLLCSFDRVPAVRPEQKRSIFFDITPIMSADRFEVRIDFLFQGAVYPILSSTLSAQMIVPNEPTRKSNRYLIVGYKTKPPILHIGSREKLDFPVKFPKITPPAIGALDLSGKPVIHENMRNEGDEYAEIVNAYQTLQPADTLRQIDTLLGANNGSHLFLPELMSMKIKIMDKLGGHDETLIKNATTWVNSYTTHVDMPEILLMLGKAEMRIGLTSDALYHYDTLIREYPETKFADFGVIYRSDRLLARGHVEEAQMGYESVYFNSKDISAASLAASRLADLAIHQDDLSKAAELYTKILQSNPNFFLDDLEGNKELLTLLVDHKLYKPASLLAEIFLGNMTSSDSGYDKRLLELARWQQLGGFKNKSLLNYERYLKEYPFAEDVAVATKERDLLRFSLISGGDSEENLELYNRICELYPEDEAANRALYEKAKLLLRFGRYEEVYKLLPSFDALDKRLFYDYDQQLRQMERTLLDSFLRENACESAVSLVRERKLDLGFYGSDGLYNCAFGERDFQIALEIINSKLARTSLSQGADWLARRMDVYYTMGNLPLYINDAERYMRMHRALRIPLQGDRYFQLFDAYRRADNKTDKMFELGATIEDRFPKDPRLMDIYATLMNKSRAIGDIQGQYAYAKKLINRHRVTHVGAFTPESELVFAEAAIKQGRNDEAIKVLETALNDRIAPRYQTRILFTLGELLEQNVSADRAGDAFRRCANLEINDDPWANLCREKLVVR
ncbi:MAG: hypothetical protein LBN32_05130 [Helicobacteraceae bacterium]|nr:hypothetical protein [Helicobacteraceae bacterium]